MLYSNRFSSVRPEHIKSSGSAADPNEITLLYGPGGGAFSFTVSPTYVKEAFFIREEFSIVHAPNSMPGFVFGPTGKGGSDSGRHRRLKPGSENVHAAKGGSPKLPRGEACIRRSAGGHLVRFHEKIRSCDRFLLGQTRIW
jgi:hypothetical protein